MYYGEKFNSISHLIGTALAFAGTALLIVLAARQADAWKIVSFSIYGTMLLALYGISTLYHSVRGSAKDTLRKFDHCAIYLLIAGSYTPFTLVTLRGAWGWSLFGSIWGLALLGIAQEIWFARRARTLSLVLYFTMGWLALIAVGPLMSTLTPSGFAWLATGGFIYTAGIAFYVTDSKVRHGHGVWHLFVMGGSICHYFAVLLYVA